jgi:hypothetical protein
MSPRPPVPGFAPLALLLLSNLIGPSASAGLKDVLVGIPSPSARTARAALPRETRAARPHATISADGSWREFDLLQVWPAISAYDQSFDQLLSISGSRPESWALPLTGAPIWQPLPASPSTGAVYESASARDPVTGLVFFLAYADTGIAFEVHTLDPRTGVTGVIVPSGQTPGPLVGPLAWDGATQRLLMFADSDLIGPVPVDVWALDLAPVPAWTHWSPSGTPPPGTLNAPITDPVRRRVLFSVLANGFWALNLDGPPAWQFIPTNALPSDPDKVVYDPVGDGFWTVLGGEPYSLSPQSPQWSHIVVSGTAPSPRSAEGLAIDLLRHRLLLFGGNSPSGDDTHSDAWALALDGTPGWIQLVPDGTRPPIRGGAGDGYDPARHRLVVFGGDDHSGYPINDSWALDLGASPSWSRLETQGGPPAPRFFHASAWDEAHDRLVTFGGYDGANPLADLWELSFAGANPTWTPITPPGAAPAGRYLANLVYDSGRDRFLLMFGGGATGVLADVWELQLSPAPAWRQLTPTGPGPAARGAAMCAYDPARDRVIVFGGGSPNGFFDDVWALNMGSGDGAWQHLPAAPGPTRRSLGLLRRDTVRDRLVLFGGFGLNADSTEINYRNDTWALSLSGTPAWHELAPTGFLPEGRDRADGAYDPVYDRLVLTCGGIDASNDLWTLDFGDAPTPTLIALATRDVTVEGVRLVWSGAMPGARATAYRRAPGAEWQAVATLTADGEGLVTLEDRDVAPSATYEYQLGVVGDRGEEFFGATTVQIPARVLSLAARAVDGRASFAVELTGNEPATLVLFDVAGRRIWSRALGDLGAGAHEVSAGDVHLAPSLYFARLTQGQESRFARFAIVR